MKFFVFKSIKFIIFFVLIYVPILCIYGELAPEKIKKNLKYKEDSFLRAKLSEIDKFHDVDILFVGSSHAYRSFDPRLFSAAGFKTFNLGSSAQTPINTEVILDRYLERLNPKTVIYEVYPETFCSDGVESTVDIISSDHISYDLFSLACCQNDIKVYNVLCKFYQENNLQVLS